MTPLVAAALAGLAIVVSAPVSSAARLDRLRSLGLEPSGRSRVAGEVGGAPLSGGSARWWSRRPGQARRRFEATSDAIVELLDAFAAELEAGRPAVVALRRAAADIDDAVLAGALAPVLGVVQVGGSVAAALITSADAPGCRALRWLGAAWTLSDTTGARLAGVVERLAAAARAEAAHRREVAAQLAGPRASARLLAALPVLGLVIGELLGAHPLAVLVSTSGGVGCLATGLALELLGLRWTRRMAAVAEQA